MDYSVEDWSRELEANLNMTVHEYFSLLTRNLSRMGTRSVIYDKSDGILWVVLTPVVYFVLVSVVLTILLVYYWHADGHADISPVGSGATSQPELAETDLPMGLNRTFLNIDGASQVMTRSSSMSKGSVRSLGTLTDLDQSAITRTFNTVFTSSNFSPLNLLQRESLEMAVLSGRKSDRATVEGNAPEQWFTDPGSGRSLNLSDFQVKYPPPMLADQFKLVWVSGDDVQSDGLNDGGYSVVSSGGGRSFHASSSTNKQTNTRDLNKSKGGHEKSGKRLAMREQLLKYGARMNKTSYSADKSMELSTLGNSVPRNYTDPTSKHRTRHLAPNSLSSGGSYLDYVLGSKEACVSDDDSSDETELRRTRHNGRNLFDELSKSDEVKVHGNYGKDGQHSSTSDVSSCGQVDMSDYQELDYFDTCEDQLEEISGDVDLTTPSAGHNIASSSMSEVFCADESSENSPPLSLPSSISRFHYSKKGAQATPLSHYPFAVEQGADTTNDDNENSEVNDTADVSLYPNEGSCSQTATVNTSRVKSNADSSSREVQDRRDRIVKEKSNPRFQSESRPSRINSTSSGEAKLKISFSEPEDVASLNDKKERIKKRKRFSLDVLNCGSVTVEDRLTEFGFLKPSGNKYIINPSPGRFFRRRINQSSESIDDGDGFSDFDPRSFSDHGSLTEGKQGDMSCSKCSNSFCYGVGEPLSLASLGDNVLAMKRDAVGDSNNNNLTYIRGGDADISITGGLEVPDSLDGGSSNGVSVNQYRVAGRKHNSVSIELSTEGHFVESSEDRKRVPEKEGWKWKGKPCKDISAEEEMLRAQSNSSSLSGKFLTSHTRPPLPSRHGDASYLKSAGLYGGKGDRNGVSRISDEVNTTFKLQQFRLHRKSTVNLFRVTSNGGQSVDSNSQGSDYFSKQHPSLMTPPTPDSNSEDRMFTVAADHRYTSTPLYRQ